jgi:hypothetical protein
MPSKPRPSTLNFPEQIANRRAVAGSGVTTTLQSSPKPLSCLPAKRGSGLAGRLHIGKDFNHGSNSRSWRHDEFFHIWPIVGRKQDNKTKQPT